jgi:hypothetical protein
MNIKDIDVAPTTVDVALTAPELFVLTDNLASLLADAGKTTPRYACPATEAGAKLTDLYALASAFKKLAMIGPP